MDIGFIGLGRMGQGMARRLLDTGHRLRAWNRTASAAHALRPYGAIVVERPDELLDAEVVITMLADDAAVEAVWLDSGLVDKMHAPSVHLNMASVSLRLGQRLAQAHRAAGTPYVAAPVFGRPEPAAKGELDIVAAGERTAMTRCEPLFEALGRRWFDLGSEPHHANVVKIARNFLLASIVESLGEAFALVGKCGVDRAVFLDIITSTSMSAPAYKNYGRLMLDAPRETPTFTLALGLKDVEIALEAASDNGVTMPLAELLRTQHLGAIAQGYGDREWASLGDYIAANAGLKRSSF